MKTGLFLKLRQLTNELFGYLYAIAFVLIGSRVALYIQQTHSFLWPCEYVKAWWKIRGSTPTVLSCAPEGHGATVVISMAIAFAIILALMRKLQWRLRLLACVAGLYLLFRLGHVINALGRDGAMALMGQALYSVRLEVAGLIAFVLMIWLLHLLRRGKRYVMISVAALLAGAFAYELVFPSGGDTGHLWKALGLTVSISLFCLALGYLPAKTTQWLRVNS